MDRTNILDTTFIIPVRIDSIDRLENLLFSTNYILRTFRSNIIVCEADERNTHLLERLLNPEVNYLFYEDPDSVFFRTKYINTVVRSVKTPYVAIWDADAIVKADQILAAITRLREDYTDFIYPYKGLMLNVPSCVKNIFFKDPQIATLEKFASGFRQMYGDAVGGGFMANKQKYMESGMENESFYGWGMEDGERLLRWQKLNYRIEQIEGILFHLDHSRGENSQFQSKEHQIETMRKRARVVNMSEESLRKEISTWHNL